ncbi:dipeptidase [Salegentibacter sp. F188]|uniref:Dipeptidase n=1 Tax=Autumnicola patrickiae TaxID=3075591 RepID=A0ABU3E2E5_9FLAO|nr:dipeptidase [Salegentibacter sp. F188]MDT0690107.1 dipeptidase [Salegentibacter sp. F188]
MKYSLILYLFLLVIPSCFSQISDEEQMIERAKRIHEKVITIDTHNDINIENFNNEKNYTMDLDTQVNLPKMEEGGLDVSWLVVYTQQGELNEERYKEAYTNAMLKFIAIHKLVNELAPDTIGLATTSDEVRKLVNEGKKVIMIGVENGYPIGEDISIIKRFYNLGARYMSLSHNGHNQLSDSNTGEENDEWLHNGLSDLGKEVIAEMNRLGMMIDVSHPSKEAIKQMFEHSKAPFIASHSSARELGNHSRNLDDELLLLFKEHGGVVQTVAFSGYVDPEKDSIYNEEKNIIGREIAKKMNFEILERDSVAKLEENTRTEYNEQLELVKSVTEDSIKQVDKIHPVNVSDFVDHIDYMVELIGIDHVGISSDFDGGGGVEGWDDASESLNITIELVKRGYSEEEISKLWGENLLRVLDEVQAVAEELQNK